MHRTRATIAVVALTALTTIAPTAVAAGDPPPRSAASDGLYARIWEGSHRAMILAEWTSGRDARFSWGISGLSAGSTYRIVGSKVNCGVEVTAESRTFRTSLVASSSGQSFGVVAGNRIGTDKTRSVSIFGPGGLVWHCGVSFNYGKILLNAVAPRPAATPSPRAPRAGESADAAFARFGPSGFTLVELLTTTTGRVTTVLHGLKAGHDYRVSGRTRSCDDPSGPGARTYGFKLQDVLISSFTSREIPLTADSLQATRSVRIVDAADYVVWRCVAPVHLDLLG